MRAAERAAWAALDQARLTLTEREQEPPCAGRWHEFTADDPDTLREAAQLCHGCPLLQVCAGVVPFVFHGAWAGHVMKDSKTITTEKENDQ